MKESKCAYFCEDGSVIVNHKRLTKEEFEKLTTLMPETYWVGFSELTDSEILNLSFDKVKYRRECQETQEAILNGDKSYYLK